MASARRWATVRGSDPHTPILNCRSRCSRARPPTPVRAPQSEAIPSASGRICTSRSASARTRRCRAAAGSTAMTMRSMTPPRRLRTALAPAQEPVQDLLLDLTRPRQRRHQRCAPRWCGPARNPTHPEQRPAWWPVTGHQDSRQRAATRRQHSCSPSAPPRFLPERTRPAETSTPHSQRPESCGVNTVPPSPPTCAVRAPIPREHERPSTRPAPPSRKQEEPTTGRQAPRNRTDVRLYPACAASRNPRCLTIEGRYRPYLLSILSAISVLRYSRTPW